MLKVHTPPLLAKTLYMKTENSLLTPMTMTVKLMKGVFSRRYGVNILVTLDMNKQECYAQLNHDYTSIRSVVQSHRIQE